MIDQIYLACLEAREAANGKPFWAEVFEKYGSIGDYPSQNAIEKAFAREDKKRKSGNVDNAVSPTDGATYTQTGDTIHVIYSNSTLKTADDVIAEFNVDMTKWQVASFSVSPRQVYRKARSVEWNVEDGNVVHGKVDDSGKMLVTTLYNIKVKFEPIQVSDISMSSIVEFYEKNGFFTKRKFPSFLKNKRGSVLEICSTDAHIGARNYLSSRYDTFFESVVAESISKAKERKGDISRIVFPILGDIFHFDTSKLQTERHQQKVETNGMTALEIFDEAVSIYTGWMEELLDIAPVEAIYVPGNHDGVSLYHLLVTISAHFRPVNTFSCDLGHEARKWRVVGRNLIGFEHGDMAKGNRVHWLQNEAREAWGVTEYAEVHSGHLHHEEVTERGGVKTRRLPAVATTDNWHHQRGYVGAIRAGMGFLWEPDRVGWTEMWQLGQENRE